MYEKIPDYLNVLNEHLKENPVWKKLAEVTTEAINELVHDNRWSLSRLREAEVVQRGDWIDTPKGRGKVTLSRRQRSNIDADGNYDFEDFVEVQLPNNKGFVTLPVRTLQDRETLVKGSQTLGFDYFSDVLQDDDYARIESYVSQFWNQRGGKNWLWFLGYIKRIRLDASTLWEYDSGDPGSPSNTTTPNNNADKYTLLKRLEKPIWKLPAFDWMATSDPGYGTSGTYPTSHIQLEYDVLDHPNIDEVGIISLFYYLAPIHLVMERFAATVYAEVHNWVGNANQLIAIPQKAAIWDTISEINYQELFAGQGIVIQQYSAAISDADLASIPNNYTLTFDVEISNPISLPLLLSSSTKSSLSLPLLLSKQIPEYVLTFTDDDGTEYIATGDI